MRLDRAPDLSVAGEECTNPLGDELFDLASRNATLAYTSRHSEDAQAQGASLDELRGLYRAPSRLVKAKKIDLLDEVTVDFIAASSFLMLATSGADGRCDVSPRGGPAGFPHDRDRALLQARRRAGKIQ